MYDGLSLAIRMTDLPLALHTPQPTLDTLRHTSRSHSHTVAQPRAPSFGAALARPPKSFLIDDDLCISATKSAPAREKFACVSACRTVAHRARPSGEPSRRSTRLLAASPWPPRHLDGDGAAPTMKNRSPSSPPLEDRLALFTSLWRSRLFAHEASSEAAHGHPRPARPPDASTSTSTAPAPSPPAAARRRVARIPRRHPPAQGQPAQPQGVAGQPAARRANRPPP